MAQNHTPEKGTDYVVRQTFFGDDNQFEYEDGTPAQVSETVDFQVRVPVGEIVTYLRPSNSHPDQAWFGIIMRPPPTPGVDPEKALIQCFRVPTSYIGSTLTPVK